MTNRQPIVTAIWDGKYRFKLPDGTPLEQTIEESFLRVVKGVYKNDLISPDELDDLDIESFIPDTPAKTALYLMCRRALCPAGRIQAGAGTDKRVTLINCFVCPDIEDSMETEKGGNSQGIMDALKVSSLTQQMGGGIGMDFSTLRPRGALVKRTGSESSGPLHFMDMWNAMCATVMSSGSRRGAMMATLSCDHPDLLDFIIAKQQSGRLTNFNVSVLVTDEFMEAVREDRDWELGFGVPRANGKHVEIKHVNGKPWYVYSRYKAKDLWDKITRSTFDYAEPGVIFISRVNEMNNLHYIEYIHCTNPCGEQPLPPNGDCNLGAVNLAVMVLDPFGDNPVFDFNILKETVAVGVRFLDNVLDVTMFPTEEQHQEAINKRRTGLGITGLANMLQQMKLNYASEGARTLVEEVMRTIRDSAYEASVSLARERGPFPAFDCEKYLLGKFIATLPERIKDDIAEFGIRNGVLLTIAPTGTTSIYYDNISSGIEPTFSWKYKRKVLQPDGSFSDFEEVFDYGYLKYTEICGSRDVKDLPAYMVSALDLKVEHHVRMQAICQKFVDSSISKTINCPVDMSFEDFQDVYTLAYDLGCKGCTTYRPSGVRGSVLSVSDDKDSKDKKVEPPQVRPDELTGITYKVRWPGQEHAIYVTMNDIVDADGMRRPFEIFVNSKSVEHQDWIMGLTRLASAVFRKGGEVGFLVEELIQVHSAMGGFYVDQKYVPSPVALIGHVIARHFEKIGIIKKDKKDQSIEQPVQKTEEQRTPIGKICPKCQAPTLIKKEGCEECLSCDYSKCS